MLFFVDEQANFHDAIGKCKKHLVLSLIVWRCSVSPHGILRCLLYAFFQGNLHDRGHLEIMRISAGLWFIERDSLIASLQLLLHVSLLDHFHCE